MSTETARLIVIYASIIVALIMFPLTWVARNVWQDKTKTRLFALLGVTSMMIFMVSIWDYLP